MDKPVPIPHISKCAGTSFNFFHIFSAEITHDPKRFWDATYSHTTTYRYKSLSSRVFPMPHSAGKHKFESSIYCDACSRSIKYSVYQETILQVSAKEYMDRHGQYWWPLASWLITLRRIPELLLSFAVPIIAYVLIALALFSQNRATLTTLLLCFFSSLAAIIALYFSCVALRIKTSRYLILHPRPGMFRSYRSTSAYGAYDSRCFNIVVGVRISTPSHVTILSIGRKDWGRNFFYQTYSLKKGCYHVSDWF